MKRSAMIADIAKGGLKMPHLERIIKTQKVIWCKRYAEGNYHPWKEFLIYGLHKLDECVSINRKIPLKIISIMHFSHKMKDMCWHSGISLIPYIVILKIIIFPVSSHLHNKRNIRILIFRAFPDLS